MLGYAEKLDISRDFLDELLPFVSSILKRGFTEPQDVYEYASDYFRQRLKERNGNDIKKRSQDIKGNSSPVSETIIPSDEKISFQKYKEYYKDEANKLRKNEGTLQKISEFFNILPENIEPTEDVLKHVKSEEIQKHHPRGQMHKPMQKNGAGNSTERQWNMSYKNRSAPMEEVFDVLKFCNDAVVGESMVDVMDVLEASNKLLDASRDKLDEKREVQHSEESEILAPKCEDSQGEKIHVDKVEESDSYEGRFPPFRTDSCFMESDSLTVGIRRSFFVLEPNRNTEHFQGFDPAKVFHKTEIVVEGPTGTDDVQTRSESPNESQNESDKCPACKFLL